MERIQRNISYLEGLIEGLDLLENPKEGRILTELIHLNRKMVEHLEILQMRIEEQDEYLEAMDEDLSLVEAYLFAEEEQEAEEYELDGDWETDDEDGYYEMECPHCEEVILIGQEIFADDEVAEITCPECEETIIVDEEDDVYVTHVIDLDNNKSEIHYYSP
jgi:predicted RNA-binding Zn-ribbon protein involved in translation (DUF1610 family)